MLFVNSLCKFYYFMYTVHIWNISGKHVVLVLGFFGFGFCLGRGYFEVLFPPNKINSCLIQALINK